MKKILFLWMALFVGGWVHAAPPPVQDVGLVQISTSVAISVSTTPALLLSTGTNMALPQPDRSFNMIVIPSSPVIQGQFMPGRVWLDIVNYSTHGLWMGYSARLSSWTDTSAKVTRGWYVEASTVSTAGQLKPGYWSQSGSIWNLWLMSDDNIPNRDVVVQQSK